MRTHVCGELSLRVRHLALRFPRLERACDVGQAMLSKLAG